MSGLIVQEEHRRKAALALAKNHGIPRTTLIPYIKKDETKRAEIGRHARRPLIIDKKKQQLIIDCIRRRDQANNVVSYDAVFDFILALKPKLIMNQAKNAWRIVKTNHKSEIKQKAVKAQATTTKRMGITVGQQF